MNSNFLFGEKGKITVFQKGIEVGLTKEPSLKWLFIVARNVEKHSNKRVII